MRRKLVRVLFLLVCILAFSDFAVGQYSDNAFWTYASFDTISMFRVYERPPSPQDLLQKVISNNYSIDFSKLQEAEMYSFAVSRSDGEWWRIDSIRYYGDYLPADLGKYRYVHYTNLLVGSRNYAPEMVLSLYKTPKDDTQIVYQFKDENFFHPVQLKGEWCLVETLDGKHRGWIRSIWLCGHPLTNCC